MDIPSTHAAICQLLRREFCWLGGVIGTSTPSTDGEFDSRASPLERRRPMRWAPPCRAFRTVNRWS